MPLEGREQVVSRGLPAERRMEQMCRIFGAWPLLALRASFPPGGAAQWESRGRAGGWGVGDGPAPSVTYHFP